MWFRGVAVYMGLCFDFGAVLEAYPDIFFALNGDVIDHRQPVGIPELRQRLPAPQLLQVGFDLVPSGCVLGNQLGDLGMSGFGLIEPSHQTVVAFLVVSLIKSNVSVFFDTLLDELGSDVDLSFQLSQLSLKGRSVETL